MIFVDTGAFLARHLERDEHHAGAVRAFERLREERTPLLTSSHVLDETVNLLARWAGRHFAAERGRAILASGALQILRPGPDQELAALAELERFPGRQVSFTDCLSFVLMRERGILDAFAFDEDFRQAGFRLWPDDPG